MFVHKKQRWTSLSSLLQRAERFCRSWHSLTSGHETQRLNQHVVSLRSCPCRSRNLAAQHSTVINHMGQKKLCANGRSPVASKRVRAKGCWFQGLCEASCHFVHLFISFLYSGWCVFSQVIGSKSVCFTLASMKPTLKSVESCWIVIHFTNGKQSGIAQPLCAAAWWRHNSSGQNIGLIQLPRFKTWNTDTISRKTDEMFSS